MSMRVENLTVRFGEVTALRDVTCEAAPGRITTVIGPNASGKSTLLRAMIGAARPAQGAVTIDGIDIRTMKPSALASRIAYVPQRSEVSAAFTVREVVELGRYALPPKPRRIDDALSRMELNDLADRPFHELSVGQQQRVTMARAVAQHEPGSVMILDEPTSAMDLRHVRSSATLLRELAAAGSTVVIVLHDFGLIAGVADAVWLLEDGRLAATGDAADVLRSEVLSPVFGIGFERVSSSGGRSWLVADPLGASSADILR